MSKPVPTSRHFMSFCLCALYTSFFPFRHHRRRWCRSYILPKDDHHILSPVINNIELLRCPVLEKVSQLLRNTIRHRQKIHQPKCVCGGFAEHQVSIHKPHFMKEKLTFWQCYFQFHVFAQNLLPTTGHQLTPSLVSTFLSFSVNAQKQWITYMHRVYCACNQIAIYRSNTSKQWNLV